MITLEVGEHLWLADDQATVGVAPLVLTALTVDELGYRHHNTGFLVAALLRLAAEPERDGLRDWLLDELCLVPDRTLAEVMIYVVEQLTGRRYGQARSLMAIAFADWHHWRGRLLLRGLKPDELSLVDVLDCVYALMHEDAERRGVKPSEIGSRIDQLLTALWLDRETWGNDVAEEAMMVPAPDALPRRT